MDFREMLNQWPSAIVSRTHIGHFTGGVISPKTLANLDSLGQGPSGRIRIGRKVAYPVAEIVRWMHERAEKLD